MEPAMNSCSVILAKELFVKKKYLKNTNKSWIKKNRDDSNHGKKKAPSKNTSNRMSSASVTSKTSKDRFETGLDWVTRLSGDRRVGQIKNYRPVGQIKKAFMRKNFS